MNFARGKIPLGTNPGDGQRSRKLWLTSVVRRQCSNKAKTRNPLKFAGCPKLVNRFQPLVGRRHHIVRTCGGDIAVYGRPM